MTEFRLFDSPGADVATITTDGGVFKPFLKAIACVDSEAKIQVHEHGLETRLVDPANVFMTDVFLAADAFESYDVAEETILGVNVDELLKLVRRARKQSDDELTLSVHERGLTATVARGYENHNVVSQGTMDLIDPDSIRGEPDLPDLDRDVHVTVDADPFLDALSYGVGAADHVEIAVKGVNQHTNALYIGGETSTREEAAAIDSIKSDETATSLYSADYMADILGGIGDVDPAEITLSLDDEYPASFQMERDGVPMQVEYMVSPRIQKE
jgi:proliferating cell nuclear antigen